MSSATRTVHDVSVVIPVYNGESTLPALVGELLGLTASSATPRGAMWRVAEIVLVDDRGSSGSSAVIRELAATHAIVSPVWLSRNFGQHAATLAGMSSSGSEWIVTMDEDGQHDPSDIAALLDRAIESGSPLVYGTPVNPPPHGWVRNLASRAAKRIVSWASSDTSVTRYQSFRLVSGEIGRSVAAYAGRGAYLDVALGWIAPPPAFVATARRHESGRPSGYRYSKLFSHFWRLFISSGTRGLRLISLLGLLFATAGAFIAAILIVQRLVDGTVPEGWTSTVVVLLVTSGATLFSLGVLAEYLGVVVHMALGKPRYHIVSDPFTGPLGRERH